MVVKFGTGGTFLESLQPFFRAIGHPDETFVLHLVGEMKGFAPITSAGIPPSLSGRWRGRNSHQLGREILNFKLTFMKLRGAKKILLSDVIYGIRRVIRELTVTQ